MLLPGDPAPNISAPSSVNPDFHFDTAAGRYVVLCFFASSRLEFVARVLEEVSGRADRFNVTDAVFFGVSVDPADRARLTQSSPGIVHFFDDDPSVRRRVRGGALWFSEFSRRLQKAPTGGAVVFSCSLLHEATPVTRGRRYAFLPFLYDAAAARVRESNRRYLGGGPPVRAGAARAADGE